MAFDWGSVIGAAVSLYGAKEGADAAKDAGKQSAAGSQASIDLSREIYNDQRALNMPAYNAGNTARDQYMRMLGLPAGAATTPAAGGAPTGAQAASGGPSSWFGNTSGTPTYNAQAYGSDAAYKRSWDEVAAHHQQDHGRGYAGSSDRGKLQSHMQELYSKYSPQQQAAAPSAAAPQDLNAIYGQWRNTPGYQFGLQEGSGRIEASAAARGGLNSGATMKALQKYGTDFADQQGYRPYMNDLSNLFGGGQQAASQIGSAAGQYGQQAGNAYQNQANARAQSTYGQQQAWGDGMNSAAGFLGDWYGNSYGGKG